MLLFLVVLQRRLAFTTFLDNLISDIKAGAVLSEYSHDNIILQQNGVKKLRFDCSGFAYYYFLQLQKFKAIEEIKKFISLKKGIDENFIEKIYAREYVDFFISKKTLHYWTLVHPINLQQGDLIVYASHEEKRCSNHCMLVDRIVNNNEQSITISVVDSSKYPHINDTRKEDETGIGRGLIVVYKNNGRYNSFLWRKNIYYRELFFAHIKE